MTRIKVLLFLSAVALAVHAPLASAALLKYAVGTCQPNLTSFSFNGIDFNCSADNNVHANTRFLRGERL